MNAAERALAKQRLTLRSAAQRDALIRHGEGLRPLFDAAERVRDGAHWLGRHPEVLAGSVALLTAARPRSLRFFWRWGQRGFFVWRLWRESDHWLARISALRH